MMKVMVLFLLPFLTIFSACAEELFDPRDHHYEFGHRVLVKSMQDADFAEILEKKKKLFLKKLWKKAFETARDKKKVSSKGLDFKIYDLKEKGKMVVVILPKAKVTAEAHFVAALYVDGKAPEIVFTLEQSLEGATVLGAWNEKGHLNFGEGPKVDPEKFRDAVLEKAAS